MQTWDEASQARADCEEVAEEGLCPVQHVLDRVCSKSSTCSMGVEEVRLLRSNCSRNCKRRLAPKTSPSCAFCISERRLGSPMPLDAASCARSCAASAAARREWGGTVRTTSESCDTLAPLAAIRTPAATIPTRAMSPNPSSRSLRSWKDCCSP